jgi:hypothetical protein
VLKSHDLLKNGLQNNRQGGLFIVATPQTTKYRR